MTTEVRPDDALDETEWFMKCSDCESEQERCFNPQQSAQFANRDGWRSLGQRIVCPKCASGYNQ